MPHLPQNATRKYRVQVSNIPPNTSMSQMRDLLQHLFPRMNQFVTGLRDQAPGKPMQATLLCKTLEQARETKDELHLFTFNKYKLRTSIVDGNLPHWADQSSNDTKGIQDELIKIERAKLALEEQERKLLKKMKNPAINKKPAQKLKPVLDKDKSKKHGQFTVPEDILSAYEITDKFGNIIRLTGAKKKNIETAVHAICSDLQKIIPDAFVPAELKNDFDLLVREKVRGNMVAIMAHEPVMCSTKYVLKYRENYPLAKNFPFLQSMRDQLYNMPQHANAPKPKATKLRDTEKAKRAGESIDNIKDPPQYLEWIQRTANNNCWYMDYALGKVLRKAYNNVQNDDKIEFKHEESEAADESKEETSAATETDNSEEKGLPKYKDLSNISVEDLLNKIKADEDMDSITRYIDIRLAKMLNKIRTEIINAATRGPGHVLLQPRMGQLGLDGQQLKSWRKIRYATLATHTSVTTAFLKQYSIVASWQSRPFKMLKYAQNNVALISNSQYKHLLQRHSQFLKGHKLTVLKTFPDDDDHDDANDDEDVDMEQPIKTEVQDEAALESTAEEIDYTADVEIPAAPTSNVAVEA